MQPEYIIIHHSLTKDSGTVSWQAIRRYHKNELGWRDIGYHFGIEDVNGEYEVLVGRNLNDTGAHCKEQGMNNKSVGICFVGNFDEGKPDNKLWDKGVNLVKGLSDILHISPSKIFGHRYFAGYKSCPGNLFDIDKFKYEVSVIK